MAGIERIHLEILVAVDRHGSLTAAAEKLHLTQSALSHSMRKLEDQLGVALWRREGRSLSPTQAGVYLLSVAHRLVPQFAHTEERLRQFAQGERGTLRIGMECHPCYQWLLKIASRYLDAWPAVDMDVKQKFQFGGIGALLGYEIDLLVTPDPLYRKGLHWEPVFDYEQVLVVGPEHPLRDATHVEPEQLADEILITYPVPPDRLDIYTRFLAPAGMAPKRHKEIETTDIMLQMVATAAAWRPYRAGWWWNTPTASPCIRSALAPRESTSRSSSASARPMWRSTMSKPSWQWPLPTGMPPIPFPGNLAQRRRGAEAGGDWGRVRPTPNWMSRP